MSFNADLHIHIALPEKELSDEQISAKLSRYKDAGVTFLRDGGDANGVSLRAKEIAAGLGIDFVTPAFAIYKKGHYGAALGKSFSSEDEFKALVDEAESLGADFIKIVATGIVDFSEYGAVSDADVLSGEELSFMTGYVHSKDMAVMAHVNGAENIKAAIAAGVDSIEHGFFMDEDAAAMLAQTDTVWVPTVTPAAALVGDKAYNQENLKKILTEHAKMINRAWYLGAMICLGTDAGSPEVPHAEKIDSEYEILKAAIDDREFDAHLATSLEHIKWKFRKA